MKILVTTRVYPSRHNWRAGVFVHDLNKELIKQGHEISVLYVLESGYKTWHVDDSNKIETYNLDGVSIHKILFNSFSISRLPLLNRVLYSRKLKKLYNRTIKNIFEYDISISHFTLFASYGYLLLRNNKKPHITIEHNSFFLKNSLNPYVKRMLKRTINDSDAFISVSNALKDKLEHHTGIKNKIIVIPNMVSPVYKYTSPIINNKFVFFSAGNLTPNKNHEQLVRAFMISFSKTDNVELRIAGRGTEESVLRKLIVDNGRSDQVILLGSLNSNDLFKQYKECSVFVLLSKHETFGIVYREANMVGRPVISSNNGGINENWDDRFGIILENNDVESTVKALRYMRENYVKFNNEEVSIITENIYSSNVVTSKINKIIVGLAEKVID